MKILVTGSRGFLGKFLCQALENESHVIYPIHTCVCDLTNSVSLDQFNSVQFDQIFHLAAWTQAGDFCLSHQGEQWVINQKINTNILDWWHQRQPQAKMICMGTSCAYDPELSLKEENYLKGSPIDSLFTYAMTKRMLLNGLQALHQQYQLEYMYFIPSTLYGPNYHLDGRQMHFIFDLIRKIIRGKELSVPVILWGDGYQERELMFVDDFVRVMLSLNKTEKNSHINIGAGKGHSIRSFARMISELVGYDFQKIQYDTSKYVGARSKLLSIDKLNLLAPDFLLTTLAQGLKETVSWFLENREILISK